MVKRGQLVGPDDSVVRGWMMNQQLFYWSLLLPHMGLCSKVNTELKRLSVTFMEPVQLLFNGRSPHEEELSSRARAATFCFCVLLFSICHLQTRPVLFLWVSPRRRRCCWSCDFCSLEQLRLLLPVCASVHTWSVFSGSKGSDTSVANWVGCTVCGLESNSPIKDTHTLPSSVSVRPLLVNTLLTSEWFDQRHLKICSSILLIAKRKVVMFGVKGGGSHVFSTLLVRECVSWALEYLVLHL